MGNCLCFATRPLCPKPTGLQKRQFYLRACQAPMRQEKSTAPPRETQPRCPAAAPMKGKASGQRASSSRSAPRFLQAQGRSCSRVPVVMAGTRLFGFASDQEMSGKCTSEENMNHAYVTLNTAGSHSSGSETPVPSLSFLQNPLLTVLQPKMPVKHWSPPQMASLHCFTRI